MLRDIIILLIEAYTRVKTVVSYYYSITAS